MHQLGLSYVAAGRSAEGLALLERRSSAIPTISRRICGWPRRI